MMKSARQSTILEIISKADVETQEELAEELGKMNITVTQATVSRDIKELRLVKVQSTKTGLYKYATSEHGESGLSDRFIRMFAESVLSVAHSGNMIVVKTLSGSANVAAEAIDSMRWPEILGTLAGDNTIFMVVRSNNEVQAVVDRISEIMK
jgi:arginine repressor